MVYHPIVKSTAGGTAIATLAKFESMWSLVILVGSGSPLGAKVSFVDVIHWVLLASSAFYVLMKYYEFQELRRKEFVELKDKIKAIKTFRDYEMRRFWAYVTYYKDTGADSDREIMNALIQATGDKSVLFEKLPIDRTSLFLLSREFELFKENVETYNKIFEEWEMKPYKDPFDNKKE